MNYSLNPRNFSAPLFQMDSDIFDERSKVKPNRLGSYYIYEANNITK